MERFLSPLRRALPDIDIDVESDRRTEIYERILQRFGGDRCACVSMMDTYRVRHAVRDVGAALAFPPGDIDTFAKAFPISRPATRGPPWTCPRSGSPPSAGWPSTGNSTRSWIWVQSLDGLPRHVALHPCGAALDAALLDRTRSRRRG